MDLCFLTDSTAVCERAVTNQSQEYLVCWGKWLQGLGEMLCVTPCGRYKICLFPSSVLYFSQMRLRNLNVSVTGLQCAKWGFQIGGDCWGELQENINQSETGLEDVILLFRRKAVAMNFWRVKGLFCLFFSFVSLWFLGFFLWFFFFCVGWGFFG